MHRFGQIDDGATFFGHWRCRELRWDRLWWTRRCRRFRRYGLWLASRGFGQFFGTSWHLGQRRWRLWGQFHKPYSHRDIGCRHGWWSRPRERDEAQETERQDVHQD